MVEEDAKLGDKIRQQSTKLAAQTNNYGAILSVIVVVKSCSRSVGNLCDVFSLRNFRKTPGLQGMLRMQLTPGKHVVEII